MTTFIHEGIEFEMPTVFKATKRDWAENLIQNGTIYFTNIRQFINDSDPQRGDPNEGRSVTIRNDVRCTAEYSMPIYVWCCTLDTRACRIIKTWPDRDCVIQVLDTLKFAKKIASAIKQEYPMLWPLHVGPVSYTKTAGGREKSDWIHGIFQKDERYIEQREYRFALNGDTGDQEMRHILLNIGSCHDIVQIVE